MAIPRQRRTSIGGAAAIVLVAATALTATMAAPAARAQSDQTPHPVHIHAGSCDNLGDIVVPLTDIELNTAGEVFGAASAQPVEESVTDVELSLSDILASPHAVNVHESADAIQNYLACGDIGGRVVDGNLLIGLMEVNGSGYSGVAKFESVDNATSVMLFLTSNEEVSGGETAAAAPTTAPAAAATTAPPAAPTEAAVPTAEPAAAVAEDVPVDIRDFAFNPTPVEIAVGGSVTWTNQDAVPHTATGEDRGALQSGTIAPGESFTQVFATAGEFAYFCEFHPGMSGQVIVK